MRRFLLVMATSIAGAIAGIVIGFLCFGFYLEFIYEPPKHTLGADGMGMAMFLFFFVLPAGAIIGFLIGLVLGFGIKISHNE